MKVSLKFNQKAYHGKLDGLVYYWLPRHKVLIARRYVEQKKQSASNLHFAELHKNLKRLDPSPAYRQDLKDYLRLLHAEGFFAGLNSWHPLYVKLMFAFAERHPEYDLATIGKSEIHSQALGCRSVKTAVEDLLLPRVKGYETLVALL